MEREEKGKANTSQNNQTLQPNSLATSLGLPAHWISCWFLNKPDIVSGKLTCRCKRGMHEVCGEISSDIKRDELRMKLKSWCLDRSLHMGAFARPFTICSKENVSQFMNGITELRDSKFESLVKRFNEIRNKDCLEIQDDITKARNIEKPKSAKSISRTIWSQEEKKILNDLYDKLQELKADHVGECNDFYVNETVNLLNELRTKNRMKKELPTDKDNESNTPTEEQDGDSKVEEEATVPKLELINASKVQIFLKNEKRRRKNEKKQIMIPYKNIKPFPVASSANSNISSFPIMLQNMAIPKLPANQTVSMIAVQNNTECMLNPGANVNVSHEYPVYIRSAPAMETFQISPDFENTRHLQECSARPTVPLVINPKKMIAKRIVRQRVEPYPVSVSNPHARGLSNYAPMPSAALSSAGPIFPSANGASMHLSHPPSTLYFAQNYYPIAHLSPNVMQHDPPPPAPITQQPPSSAIIMKSNLIS